VVGGDSIVSLQGCDLSIESVSIDEVGVAVTVEGVISILLPLKHLAVVSREDGTVCVDGTCGETSATMDATEKGTVCNEKVVVVSEPTEESL
jgi:hypothetical protein